MAFLFFNSNGEGGVGTGANRWVDLTDTPGDLTGQAGKIPVVNAGGNALELQVVAGATNSPNSDLFIIDATIQSTRQITLTATPIGAFFISINGIGPLVPGGAGKDFAIVGAVITFVVDTVLPLGKPIHALYWT